MSICIRKCYIAWSILFGVTYHISSNLRSCQLSDVPLLYVLVRKKNVANYTLTRCFLITLDFDFILTKRPLSNLFIQRFLSWISLVYNKKYANKVLRYLKTFRIQLFWITFNSELSVDTFPHIVAASVLRTWWCSLLQSVHCHLGIFSQATDTLAIFDKCIQEISVSHNTLRCIWISEMLDGGEMCVLELRMNFVLSNKCLAWLKYITVSMKICIWSLIHLSPIGYGKYPYIVVAQIGIDNSSGIWASAF